MQTVQVGKTKDLVPLAPNPIILVDQVVACGVEMAGIGTEGDSMAGIVADQGAQQRQLLEGAAQGGAAPGGRLQQDHHRAGHPTEASGVSGRVAGQTGIAVVDVVARVRHQVGNTEGLAAAELLYERRLRPST